MAKKWNDEKQKPPKQKKEILIGQEVVPEMVKKPMGRPKGVSMRQVLWNEKVVPKLEQLVEQGLQYALRGDASLIRLFLERGLPKNPVEKPLTLSADAGAQINHILAYHSEGYITAEEAVKLCTIVKDKVTVDEIKGFAAKLSEIENWMKDQSQGITINGSSAHGKEMDSGSDKE